MEIDLSIRLHAYSTTADAQTPEAARLYADALASSGAAFTSASASIISSHARALRGDSPPPGLRPGQDEVELLAAEKPAGEDVSHAMPLPLRSGHTTVDDLARGAAGVEVIKNAAIKNQNG